MEVGFRSDRVYVYENVSAQRHRAFMASPSLGKYMWRNIRNKYPFTRLK